MHCRLMDLSFNYVKQGRTSPSPKTANYLSIPYYLLIWSKYMHAEQRKTSEDTGILPSNAISDYQLNKPIMPRPKVTLMMMIQFDFV